MGEVTVSAVTVTTFGDVAGGDTYFATMLASTAWTGAATDTKGQGLATATRYLLDVGVYDPDTGLAVTPSADDTGVPEGLIEGTYELARAMIADPAILDKIDSSTNQKRVKAGSAEVEFFRPVEGGLFPARVQRAIGIYINPPRDVTNVLCTDEDEDRPELYEGFA